MSNQLFKEETIYSVGSPCFCDEFNDAVHAAIRLNHAVGFVAGYYDKDLTIAYVSAFFLHNLGYSFDEFMAATSGSLRNAFCGENTSFLEPERFPCIHGAGEAQLLTKDRVPVNIHAYKVDTKDSTGRPIWVLSAQMDPIQDSLSLITRSIGAAFWSIDFDADGQPQSVHYSHEFRKMLGYHDVLDFPNSLTAWPDALHPHDLDRVMAQFEAAYRDHADESKFDAEYRMRLADGSYQWFRSIAEITRRIDGTPYRMAGIFVNIDKRKRNERHTHMMDTLIHGTTKLVDRYATYNLENGTYRFYSQCQCDDAAYPLSGTYQDLIAAVEANYKAVGSRVTIREAFAPETIRAMLTSEDDIYRFEYCTLDDAHFKTIAITPLSWKNGKLTAVLMMTQDTTAENLAEIEARRALKDAYEAANRANRAKTEFLSNMSHDIRTPMNAIIGMTAIAGAHIDDRARVLDCLGKITQSSRHLLGLINEILDMSRIESGKIALAEEEFNLSDLCDNLITMTKTHTDAHHHTLDVHINSIAHEDVCGDSMRLQQLLTNLLSNAIKYTPDGGRIDFTISELPSGPGGVGCYEFIVQDNGIGMTPEFQRILFDPFTRADDKRTSKVQGTGLGMAIARNFAQMMNGDIKVESAPGKGSKFTVTVFLKQQNKTIAPIAELIDLPVLVVDDDQTCCETTVALLEEIGIDGEYVTSGEEAVERTLARYEAHDNYFAIILDWKMPGMDGIETARRIRQRVGRDVTIIILSSFDYSAIEREARAAGVDEFIAKPLFRSRLTALFKELLSGKATPPAQNYLTDLANCDYTGKRILLAEDNDLNREIACEVLGMTGATLDTVTNGREAVDRFALSDPGYYSMILMDIQMPLMNGYEATTAIRKLHRPDATTVPIVAMTANAFAEDVQRARDAGMNEHLSKPLDMTRLRAVLQRWL